MRKSILFLAMSALILLMASCNSKEKKLIGHIPSDAVGAVAVNVKSLAQKSGGDFSGGTFKLPPEIDSAFSKSSEDQNLKKSIEALPSSGIDFDCKAFVFFSSKNFQNGALIKVSDSKALKQFLIDKAKLKISDGDGCHYFVQGNAVTVFNDDVLFIGDAQYSLSESKTLLEAQKLLTLDKKDTYLDDGDAVDALTTSDDASIYFNYKSIKKTYIDEGEYKSIVNSNQFLSKILNSDVSGLLCSVNFNDKDITCSTKIIGDKDSPLCKLLDDVIGDPDSNALKFIPKNAFSIFAFSLNGEALLKIPEFAQLFANIPDNPYASKDDLKKIISDIDGDVIFSSYSIGDASESPFYGAIKTKDAKFVLNKISAVVGAGSGVTGLQNGEVAAMITDSYGIIFGAKDGYLYFRTVPQPVTDSAYADGVVKEIFDKSSWASYVDFRSGSPYASLISDYVGFNVSGYIKSGSSDMTINSDLIIENPVCKNSLQALIKIISAYTRNQSEKAASIGAMAEPDSIAADSVAY